MKTKGITIWEQHAEKIVLGIASVVAIGLVAKQFIGEPNAVSTPAGNVSPAEIDGRLQSEAERYLARLDDRAAPEVELPEPPPAHESLRSAIEQPVNPGEQLPLAVVALAPSVEGVGPSGSLEFAVPEIKAPVRVVAQEYADALDDGVLDEQSELARLFAEPGQPPDLKFVTVYAQLDLADLRAQFKGDHVDLDAEGKVAIPTSWYHDRPGNIVDVVIAREELVGGEWTDHRVIDTIPGQVNYRDLLASEINAAQRDDVLLDLSNPSIQRAVIQPEFYPTRNEVWSVALMDDEPEDEGVDPRLSRIRTLLQRKHAERQRTAQQIEDLGGSVGDPPEPDEEEGRGTPPKGTGDDSRRSPPGMGGGGFGPGGAGGGKRGSGVGGQEEERRRDKLEGLNDKIDKLDRDILRLEREHRDLGGGEIEVEIVQTDPFDPDTTELLVWGHDLDAVPGHTYRYAVSVRVYNPFFGKKRSLVKEQQHLADTFTLDSATSEWTEEIRIAPFTRVWVTGATPAGQVSGNGMGYANVEVYRFYDGRQWMKVFRVQPGDYVGGVEEIRVPDEARSTRIDFSTGLIVVDIVEDIGGPDTERRFFGDSSAATVLLQDLASGDMLPAHDPRVDQDDPVRRELQERAEETGA